MAGILVGARSAILATARLEPQQFDRGIGSLEEWSMLPDAAFWFAMCWAEGVRKGAV
jgi:hypothetical protein